MNNIKDIISAIKANKDILSNNFGVDDIAVFGSYVKNLQKTTSDIDVFVTFKKGYKTFDNFMELKFYLENLLKFKIDLVIKESIRKEFKDAIYKEAVHV